MANPLICVFNPITTLIDQIASASAGPGVAGSPVVLNQNGLIDPSLVGTGLTAIAGESISGGRLVTLYSLGGNLHMELSYADVRGSLPPDGGLDRPLPAIGFITSGIAINNTGLVQFSGVFTYVDPNAEFLASDISAEVYLSATAPFSSNGGGITKTRPSGVGQLQQTVGTVVGFTAPNFVQVAFVPLPQPPLLNFGNISTGTNTTATMTVGTGATLTFSGSGVVNANELTGDPVNTSGRTTGQSLVWNGTTWVPSNSAATSFSAITSGTNTTAAMVVGSSASITVTGSGSITATQLATTGAPVVVSTAAPPTVGQTLTATSATTAAWMSGGSGTPGGSPTNIQFNNTGTFGGIPGSSADGVNGTMSLAPTGTGVALSVTGDATSDIIEMFTNAASPVLSLNKFGAAVHTVTRTGGTTFAPFYNGSYVQHNTSGGGAVIIVTGLSSTVTYLGTAGDPVVSLITGSTSVATIDGTSTDNIQSLVGAQISSNVPTAYVGNLSTGISGANISTEHQGSGTVPVVEALILTAGGNNQVAPVGVVSGLHVMQPQGGIMNFTGTTSVSGVVIDDQSTAPPVGATVAALRIKSQTGTGTSHYAILVDGGVSAFKGLAPRLVTKVADYVVTRNDYAINVDATTPPHTFAVTAAANAVFGTTDYTGTFTGGAGNAWVGYYITIDGFGNANNNGSWICTASSNTTITLQNGAGVAEVSGATATWFLITLPVTNLVANQIFRIKKIDASGPPTNAVTVISTANIDFTTAPGSVGLTASLQAVEVQWDGTQYWIY